MVSCIEIETASLVFACLSMLITSLGSLVCIAMLVHVNVIMIYIISTAIRNMENFGDLQLGISNYGLYVNVGLAVTLSIVGVSLMFSMILTRGLLTKKAYLVKAYFVYGVTANTILALFVLFASLTCNVQIGLISFSGCFLYGIILMMIKRTYLKLSTANYDQFCIKKLEAEKQIA